MFSVPENAHNLTCEIISPSGESVFHTSTVHIRSKLFHYIIRWSLVECDDFKAKFLVTS